MSSRRFLKPELDFASDHTLLVRFSDEISPEYHANVHKLTRLLLEEEKEGILNVHPAYASVLVTFDPMKILPEQIQQFVRKLIGEMESVVLPDPRFVEIPVCYGDESGPDLADVAAHNDLKIDEVIRIHSSAEYLVYFLGFAPGFPYLGGMSERIAAPRLSTPRTVVPAGSVGIAGRQTGVYSASSPGGWRIIGRTPMRLFHRDRDPLTLLQMGDRVKFLPITKKEFEEITKRP